MCLEKGCPKGWVCNKADNRCYSVGYSDTGNESDTGSDDFDTDEEDDTDPEKDYCGDGACNGDETTVTCADDCGLDCGDGVCNGNESSISCDKDCGSICGDGACNGDEDCDSCASDCGSCCVPDCSGDQCGQYDGCGGTCSDADVYECGKCGNSPCGPVTVFEDDFEQGLGKWNLSSSGDWYIDDGIEGTPSKSGSYHAEFDNDDDGSDYMETGPFDTSSASVVTLSSWAYLDDDMDNTEDYLKVWIWDGSDYHKVLTFNARNDNDNDKWEYYEVNITSYKDSQMWISFSADTDNSNEKLGVDLVKVITE